MQVRSDVRKVMDANISSARAATKRLAHGALVPAQRPGTPRPVAVQRQMNRPSRAHGALALSVPLRAIATMLPPQQLAPERAGEEVQLHFRRIARFAAGQYCFCWPRCG
jgi:hypothetical protein